MLLLNGGLCVFHSPTDNLRKESHGNRRTRRTRHRFPRSPCQASICGHGYPFSTCRLNRHPSSDQL